MRLFYTGAKAFNEVQNKPSLSLGGYLSSSAVPNGSLGNLFSDISLTSLKDKSLIPIICVIIKNETGSNIVNTLYSWFEYNSDAQTEFEIGFSTPQTNAKNEILVELIQPYSIPSGVTFYKANGVSNKLFLNSLANNAYLALWIRRSFIDNLDYYSDAKVIERYEAGNQDSEILVESSKLQFTW